jgi:MSHA biogenesis protein MshL
VIGGLMTERTLDDRNKIPGFGDVPGLGAAFRNGAQRTEKRELVILLRSTVVKDEDTWGDDIDAMRRRIEGIGQR